MNCNVLADNILRLVGGESNVISVIHCATRLRFTIIDNRKAKLAELRALDGVLTVVSEEDRLQVVIGNRVEKVFHALSVRCGSLSNEQKSMQYKRAGCARLMKWVDDLTDLTMPLLGVMMAAGILKGILIMSVDAGWLNRDRQSAATLFAIAESPFNFLPIFLAILCARKFKANLFIAVAMAGASLSPLGMGLPTTGQTEAFPGLSLRIMNNSGSMIPVIAGVWLLSRIEQAIDRYCGAAKRAIATPCLLILIVVPFILLILFPVGVSISQGISALFSALYSISPIFTCALMAAAWPLLLMLGLHQAFIVLFINDISVMGQSFLLAACGPAIFACSAMLLAVNLRTRNSKLKALTGAAIIPSLFGLSEPAIYGVTLKRKKMFFCVLMVSAFGGAMVGYGKSFAIAMALPGVLTFPVFYGEGVITFILACSLAFLGSLGLILLTGFEEGALLVSQGESSAGENIAVRPLPPPPKPVSDITEQIIAPVSGELISLADVNDGVFSTGSVGPGFAIIPDEGYVYSPVDGYISNTYASRHAIGIRSNAGAEILIHVGINTVQLAGNYFWVQVKAGEAVKQGQLLMTFDLLAIAAEGYDTVTPVIITNSEAWRTLDVSEKPRSRSGERSSALSV
ncbi:PTS transporter subunit EIIC [Kosakonia sp. SMBL-WEM22]|uniref:glucose PTS transporter subunit IIA n=1 Tax=Kosakonia sp. SMBL-WEM22 TaxID=2725560 RepID=UPI0016599813|nr:glucose PTS transporter subunit IIA [Kosakonia sp. SMBL-WEM22]MDV5355615.1 glucose PTS transporter subunit IIA [Enterobacter asburiae]QNQ19445.1 PTS transporter subunit EIIC [Kosakonia sp. SMBL-WEM22]